MGCHLFCEGLEFTLHTRPHTPRRGFTWPTVPVWVHMALPMHTPHSARLLSVHTEEARLLLGEAVAQIPHL